MATKSIIQNAAAAKTLSATPGANTAAMAKQTTTTILNSIMDSEGYRKRFDEIMGARAPQFISSIVSMVNQDTMLKAVVQDAPQTIITAALKAASLDLTIDPALGMAYVMPFKNRKKVGGEWISKNEATLVIG